MLRSSGLVKALGFREEPSKAGLGQIGRSMKEITDMNQGYVGAHVHISNLISYLPIFILLGGT